MSSNLVIVAIPAADDRIWKISSEKIPHLTLLFLGDAENNPNINRIYQFVWHAVNVSEHGPFYLDVDRRDVLGEDKADVLHFRKDWSFKWLNQFRNQLLQHSDIRTAYDSTEQFPEWQPHLTLGYPETPAHEDQVPEYGFSMVQFDRIAVWTGNYEGPQFRLEWPEREEELAVAYSETGKEAVSNLLHVSEKPWSDYTKADYSIEQWHAACLIHLHEDAPTSKSECKLPVKTPGGALNRNGVHAAAAALAGARGGVDAPEEQKAKAATALRGYYKQLDEDPPESLAQTAIFGEEFVDNLIHYGIKGMRWGQRKAPPTPVAPRAVSKVPQGAKRKTKIEVEGGENHDASEDAIKVAQAKAKLQKSGPAALSNKELQEVANRVELEQRVKRAVQPSGQKFVSNLLRSQGSQGANQFVSKQIKRKMSPA